MDNGSAERPGKGAEAGGHPARGRGLWNFAKHYSKELTIAFVLAVIAAFMADPVLMAHERTRARAQIAEATNATALIETFDEKHQPMEQGSGVFISKDGILVTNYHVVKDAAYVEATLPTTGAIYRAKNYLYVDKKLDIATIQFEAKDVPFVTIGNSDVVEDGEKVLAIGNPQGLTNSISEGVISNAHRKLDGNEVIQFSAPISSGSSGGGLYDENGRVIGLTAATLNLPPELAATESAQSLNFAVPINLIRDHLSDAAKSLQEAGPEQDYAIGKLKEADRNFDAAIEAYNRALQADANFVPAYLALGGIYYEQGDFDNEITAYKKATELNPTNFEPIFYLGSAYEDKGQYQDAIESYKKALSLKPGDKDSLYYLAILDLITGNKSEVPDLITQLEKQDAGLATEVSTLLSKTK